MGLGDAIQALAGYPDAHPMTKAIGLTVESVDAKQTPIKLKFTNGAELTIDLEGDCCSSSYFSDEGLEDAKELAGRKIVAVEKAAGESGLHPPYGQNDVTAWHFLKFTTDAGNVTIDWRNDSNGYYNGWVVASFKESK